jgi:hypothetical protein
MRNIFALTLLATALAGALHAVPAQAQATRTFVSGSGSDSNACTATAPCRTFQAAYNAVAAGGEIDVLDPAGYGPLTIGKALSIQAHGFGGITAATSGETAITVAAGSTDDVTLNGLLIDGAGTGNVGISITSGGAVQILNCVVRHFTSSGINYVPTNTPADLLVSDTIASDISGAGSIGVNIGPSNGVVTNPVTLSRITANNNLNGVLVSNAQVMIVNSVMSNGGYGLVDSSIGGTIWLAKSKISGNTIDGVDIGGTVYSYGDNDINGNATDINNGGLTSVSTQ